MSSTVMHLSVQALCSTILKMKMRDLKVLFLRKAESTDAMWIKCLAQGNNILMLGFEPSTSVTRNRHSSQTTNMLYLHGKRLHRFTTVKRISWPSVIVTFMLY